MIRFVVGLFLFAVALCAYIVTRPYDDGRRPAQPIVIAPEAPAVVEPLAKETPDIVREVSAAEALAAIVAVAEDDVPQASELGFMSNDDPLEQTIRNVLIALRLEQSSAGDAAPLTSLELLLVQSMRDRVADERIAKKIAEGAAAGAIAIPAVLVKADGGIDTPTLLAAIIGRASILAGSAAAPIQTPAMGQIHVVVANESLAGIAVHYYGDIVQADVILGANSGRLSRPDAIAVGQELVIPAL